MDNGIARVRSTGFAAGKDGKIPRNPFTQIQKTIILIVTNEVASITVLIPHRWSANVTTNEIIAFSVMKQGLQFKAVPMITKEARIPTGLPEALSFSYVDHRIITGQILEEETMEIIGNIVVELKMQGMI